MSKYHSSWEELPRQGLIWLENDGNQQFTRHAVTDHQAHIVSADLGDMDGDGRLDIIAGGMNIFPPFPPPELLGRVTLWLNRIPTKQPAAVKCLRRSGGVPDKVVERGQLVVEISDR